MQILQEDRGGSLGRRLNESFKSLYDDVSEHYQQKDQAEQLAGQQQQENDFLQRMGIDLSAFKDPKMRGDIIKNFYDNAIKEGNQLQPDEESNPYDEFDASQVKQQQMTPTGKSSDDQGEGFSQKPKSSNQSQLKKPHLNKKQKEQQAKWDKLNHALGRVGRMKLIRKKNNLGVGTKWSFKGETQRDAGEYQQIGKSLIQYASPIIIRNKEEFKTLAEKIFDPDLTDAEAEGVLESMENLIRDEMEENTPEPMREYNKKIYGSSSKSGNITPLGEKSKSKRSMESFLHG